MRRMAALAIMAALAGCIPRVDGPPDADRVPPPTAQPDIDTPADADPQGDRRTEDGVSVLQAPRPAWEMRTVAADARRIEDQSYVVRSGDTLSRISEATGAGADAIAHANDLAPPYVVAAGRRLRIPGGRYHLVLAGQSGIAIARAYGVPWARVVEANGLVEPFLLRTGQRVLIPDLTPAQPGLSTASQRAAAFTLDIDEILTGGEPALATNQAPSRPTASARRVLPPTAVVAAPKAPPARGFGWPAEGRIVTRFGPGASGERQNGVNIATPLGTPIRATTDGVVAYAGTAIPALGGLIIVKHGGGWTSVYGYAAKLLVQRGQAVKKGQPIAVSGQTGGADRPAVHFELRKGRTPVDPQSQLPPL